MTPEDLKGLLSRSVIVCKIQRDEVLVETCRFCGNTRWNLELNADLGVFHCWACDAGGRLDELLRTWLGGEFYIPVHSEGKKKKTRWRHVVEVSEGKPAFELISSAHYLRRRGIDEHTAKVYDLRVCTEEGHLLEGRLVIPLRDFWSGVCVGAVGRSYTHKRPKYLSTLKQRRIVTGHRVRSWQTACVVVEGDFDGIAIHRSGYHVVVLGGVTAPWVTLFGSRVPQETPIVVMLDGEAREEAERLCWLLKDVRNTPPILAPLPAGTDPSLFEPNVLQRVVEHALC